MPRLSALRLVVLVFAFASAGCRTTLMPTPAAVAIGSIDPFESVPDEHQHTRAPVFVASARAVSGDPDPQQFYTNTRTRDVHLGLAMVEFGDELTWDQVVDISRATERRDDPVLTVAQHEAYGLFWKTLWPPGLTFDPAWQPPAESRAAGDRFASAINEMLERSDRRTITLYVHGYNSEFTRNVVLTGEFWHYMGRDGVVVCFDWASHGGILSYAVDKANADFAVWQLRRLLEFLADSTDAEQINIIAHSAGSAVTVEALRQISLMHYDEPSATLRASYRIGRVVLAAPDMDLDTTWSARVDGSMRVVDAMTIYASRHDRALGFASRLFAGTRLGNSVGRLYNDVREAMLATDTQLVDVTRAEELKRTLLGHSYYQHNPLVSTDVMLFLETGAPGEARGLVRNTKTGFLEFPEDYEQRLPEIVRELRRRPQIAPPGD